MAPSTSIEEKFKFLLSCIRWSNNGVIDFKAVAEECEIVSRAAASKRYSRLMKEHGINHNGSLTGNEGQFATPDNSQATPKKTQAKSSNKRKLDQLTEPLDKTDDEKGVEQAKKKSPKKSSKPSALAAVKKEEGPGMSSAGINDELVPDDSIPVGFLGEPEETSDVSIKTEEHADEV